MVEKRNNGPKTAKRPPENELDAAVIAGQGDPTLGLAGQVRGQVNSVTIDALANAAERAVAAEAAKGAAKGAAKTAAKAKKAGKAKARENRH